jgi:hypothetical protein
MSNGVSGAWIAKLRDLNPGWIHGAAHLTHSTGTKPVEQVISIYAFKYDPFSFNHFINPVYILSDISYIVCSLDFFAVR